MQQTQNNHNPVAYFDQNMHKTQQVTSRLAKREQDRLAKQTVALIVIVVVVLIVFLFAVIPSIIRLSSSSDTGLAGTSGDSVPPRPPSISSPIAATFSAQLTISGFSEAGAQVVSVINGQKSETTSVLDDGSFQLPIALVENQNELTFFAIDKAGNESETTKPISVIYDNQPPKIEIESPQDGQQFELRKNQSITVSGKTEANAKVYLNNRLVFASSEGAFTTPYQLAEGENELLIKVIDTAGNQSEQKMKVTFRL